jgi:hypothetical protein
VRTAVALIALARDDERRADEQSALALERGRSIGDLQVLYPALAARAVVELELAHGDAAQAVVDEFIEHARTEVERTRHFYLPWTERLTLMWLCLRHGYADEVLQLLAGTERWKRDSPWTQMLTAVLDGKLGAAASVAEERLLLSQAAFLRLKGAVDVDRALDFYRRAGATRYARAAEALIAKSA